MLPSLTKEEAKIHKSNGGQTTHEWRAYAVMDEDFPNQVVVASTCFKCSRDLRYHPTEKTIKGVLCFDCSVDLTMGRLKL